MKIVLKYSLSLFLVFLMAGCKTQNKKLEPYEIIIHNGRVIDPETGYDEVTDIAINGGKIVAIGQNLHYPEAEIIDATSLIVSPGFIDILSSDMANKHAHTHKITDGVTTTMGMHGGPVDPLQYAETFNNSGALINYGRTVGHRDLRHAIGLMDGSIPATEEQIDQITAMADKAIKNGAAGIGFGINYIPGASYEEVFALFKVAANNNVPCHLHARYKGNIFPGTMSLAVMEVIANASATGAQAQLAHLTSSTVGSAPLSIALIEGAKKNGIDVGFDFHVWTRNMTTLQSALYDPGWEERFGGITYENNYVATTQEQLNKERFFELREVEKPILVQTEFISEDEIKMAIKSPLGIISSDGAGLFNDEGHEKETGHPRSTGTFSRFIRKYVREEQVIKLPEAIAKLTLLPAQRLEKSIPAMERKGRIQVGMDADITVFDFNSIRENADYQFPFKYSTGVKYVLVNGQFVIKNEEIIEEGSPGQWMKHENSGVPVEEPNILKD